ncbi:dual specificity protein phosphatase 22 isoform X3 [Halyomorpha halys]
MKNILRNRHIFFKDAVFLHYSVIGGVFSSIGSMFGKLSSSIEGIFLLTVLLFILMIGFNTMGMLFFAKGLHTAPSSIHATLISSASNYVSTVLPGLYVGNFRDSKDCTQLDRFKISHIVAIHDAARRLHPDKQYLCVMASDTPDQNLVQYFPICNDFIHAARLRGGNVLIHCLAGMSRSVTVAVAYIMTVTSLSWKDALKVVRVGRSVANPNAGFQLQLEEFEMTKLAEERRRLKERFPSLALAASDEAECQLILNSYDSLLLSKKFCEGNCPMGQVCPSGLCRSPSKT